MGTYKNRAELSILQVAGFFPDGNTTEQWFIDQRWANGVYCPVCESYQVSEPKTKKQQLSVVRSVVLLCSLLLLFFSFCHHSSVLCAL